MNFLLLASILYFVLFGLLLIDHKNKSISFLKNRSMFLWIILAAFLLRCILAASTHGYTTDMDCWRAWSTRLASNLPWHFYADNYFCDYPPGYLWILYPVGLLRRLPLPTFLDLLILKIPAICADILCGLVLYKAANSNTSLKGASSLFLAFYLLNPAVIMNSAVWGQVDSIFTLFLLLAFLALYEEKYPKSAVLLAISVALKPQALLLTPLFLCTAFINRRKENFGKLLLKTILYGFGTFFILILPFIILKPVSFIFSLYGSTLSSYPYASLNAYNLFTLLGANGVSITELFMGVSYQTIGTVGILFSILLSLILFFKSKDSSRFFYTAALLLFGVFTLGCKMHERYLFPTLALFFLTYLQKRDKRLLFLSGFLSILHFFNVYTVYESAARGIYYITPPDALSAIVSFLTLATYIYAVYLGISLYIGIPEGKPFSGKSERRITRKDSLILTMITLLYACISFVNLGDATAPTTPAGIDNLACFQEKSKIASFSVYKGIGDCTIWLESSLDGATWSAPEAFEGSPCFKWTNYPYKKEAKFIRIRFTGKADNIYEAAFYDENGARLPLISQSALFDEQSLAKYENTYKNSTYFDEIYHARSAYEHIEYLPHYETTHPPLGKLIIGLGIRLFGMNPFGWRFMGNLFGILLLPLLYIFAKRLLGHTFFATSAILLFAFDFMHFSQTRIATIDTYGVFFILLAYYFMYLFYERAKCLPPKRLHLYLLLSGINFGLAIASKWIGFYAGAGLAILFFIALYRRVREKTARELLICGFCILYFVVIPFIIYYISYIPIHIADGAESFWHNFWMYQKHMFSYHAGLTEGHPFQSAWYTWPLLMRPVWYYGQSNLAASGLCSSIVGMGNPFLWWLSFGAVLYCLLRRFAHAPATFISIGFLSQYLPWIFIKRACFIYHYFASVPFAILALCYLGKIVCLRYRNGKKICILVLLICGILFLAFYPVLSGTPCPRNYVKACLSWFPSWTLGY